MSVVKKIAVNGVRVFLLGLCLLGPFALSSPQSSPLEAMARSFMKDLLEISDLSKKMVQGSSDLEILKKQKLDQVSRQIDWVDLSRSSLGPQWKKISESERKDFLATLQELLEEVVFPLAKKITMTSEQMDFSVSPKIKSQVKIQAKIEREKRGEIVQQELEVDLVYSKTKPERVVDAVIEGEKLSVNLRRQFEEALKKKTFSQILEKMKTRVKDARVKNLETAKK